MPSALLLPALLLALPALDSGDASKPSELRGTAPSLGQDTPGSELATRRALASGLAFLARAQEASGDGSFSLPLSEIERESYAPLGVSALCTLAFLAAGNAPARGPYGAVVSQALDYLLLHCDLSSESKVRGYISVPGDRVSQTFGHGYATLVLAQAYGMSTGSERIRNALIAGVRRIEESQGAEGGWYYEPWPTPLHEGSVTICLVQALRAARNSGIQVDGEVISRAEDYVRRLQKDDGTFRYTLGDSRSSIALTGAAIATLNAAGRYDDVAVNSGIDAIWSGLGLREETGREAEFPEYERLYLAQAFWQLADTTHFTRWFERERTKLVYTQDSDGSWKGSRFGDCYSTAVNCLTLSLPEGLLPIFQR